MAIVNQSQSSGFKLRCLYNQTLTVFTLFCVLGGVVYIVGFGNLIHEVVDQLTTPQRKTQIQKRRYDSH